MFVIGYPSLISKWWALFELRTDERKKILETLHDEVKKGFDVITRISMEELSSEFTNKEVLSVLYNNIESIFSYSVWGGYMLNLIFNARDPEKEKFKEKKETIKLGSKWVEIYHQDRAMSLVNKIDPLITAIFNRGSQVRLNQLFAILPDLQTQPYRDVALIEQFINWSNYQGYILAELERLLNLNNE